MVNFLLSTVADEPIIENPQGGIPPAAWIIGGIILAIILLVVAIKSFWISKSIATISCIGGIVFSIMTMSNSADEDTLLIGTIICGVIFVVSYVFLMGNMMFDSETEGDYLIAGSLVHDTNHPFKAFCEAMGGIAALAFFIFWAAYAWTFVIALIAFIITLGLNVAMIIERIRG